MDTFTTGDEASRWLEERLLKLEEAVRQAPELRRLVSDGTRDVLIDVDANPHLFYQDATDRLRRYTSQVSQAALRRLERDGFQRGVLERSSLSLLGRDEAQASRILRAMAETLRERTEALSQEGTLLYEEGRDAFTEAIHDIRATMKEAEVTWSTRGPGRHRDSVLPWRKRRAARLTPMDDPTFRAAANGAVSRHRGDLEGTLEAAGRGSVLLSIARYYGDIANLLSDLLAAGANLRRHSAPIGLAARQRLSRLRAAASGVATPTHSGDAVLIDDETLDAVLDRLDVDSRTFLERSDLSIEAMASLSREELEEHVRTWVESQLGGLGGTSLAEVLGGLAGDTPQVRRRLLEFMARGQPLVHVNDDLPLNFEGGMRGQYTVIAEATDGSLTDALREACHQMGLPDPHLQLVASEEGALELRVLQMVAGLPLFTQVDRLMPMIDLHRQVFQSERGVQLLSPSIPPDILRDMEESESFSSLLPEAIEEAFRHEQALVEPPRPADLDHARRANDPDRRGGPDEDPGSVEHGVAPQSTYTHR